MVTHIARAAFAPASLVSRDSFGSPVPRQPAHLHTQAETGVYVRDPSISAEAIPNIFLYKRFGVTVQIDHGHQTTLKKVFLFFLLNFRIMC